VCMGPSRRVGVGALRLVVLGVLVASAPALAQTFDDFRPALDPWPDPLARSPRLIGMGHLSLVVDDPHSRITLWDFARNPTGIIDGDSSSTLEIGPSTAGATSLHDLLGPGFSGLRQDLASSEVRTGYEAWHRRPKSNAYGVIGDFGTQRLDRPWSTDVEKRVHDASPRVMPVLTGPTPRVLYDLTLYALRTISYYLSSHDRYRAIVRNSVGEYIDRNGDIGDPPDFFTPDERTARTLGAGVAISYRLGALLTAAVGLDRIGTHLAGTNTGGRHQSEIIEDRKFTKSPENSGQATLIGRVGRYLEWGADGRAWKTSAEERWVFSVSAGPAAMPLSGRGTLLKRDEEGTTMRTRARLTVGGFELGAGLNTNYRRVQVFAPDPSDTTSFNHFLNTVFYRNNADSLVMPDSVASNDYRQRGWEAGGGLSWHAPNRRTVVGAEYHRDRQVFQQELGGLGPERIGWEVRAGLEQGINRALVLRGGYIHRWEDRDRLTLRNEYLSHTVTIGAGLEPDGAHWSLDSAYGLGWSQADFGDPGKPRGIHHQLALRWQLRI